MWRQKAGFTLLELLIAAALVAVLTMFATVSFRQTASDIRVENAKRSADTIAVAVYRFQIAYDRNFGVEELKSDVSPAEECNAMGNGPALQTLIDCGFLAYRQYWDPSEFDFKVSGENVIVTPANGSRIRGFDQYITNASGFKQAGY